LMGFFVSRPRVKLVCKQGTETKKQPRSSASWSFFRLGVVLNLSGWALN